MLTVSTLLIIGMALAADTPMGGDFLAELWTMIKVAGPVGFALVWWQWRGALRRWEQERSEFKAEIARLHEGREAMQERTLTTLQQSRETSEKSTNAILELTELTRVLFDWLKDRIRDIKQKT